MIAGTLAPYETPRYLALVVPVSSVWASTSRVVMHGMTDGLRSLGRGDETLMPRSMDPLRLRACLSDPLGVRLNLDLDPDRLLGRSLCLGDSLE